MEYPENISNLVTGNLGPEEKKEIISEINSDPRQKKIFRKAKISWALMSSLKEMPDEEIDRSLADLKIRIRRLGPVLKLRNYLKYAAVLLLLAGLSSLMYYLGSRDSFSLEEQMHNTSIVADRGQISKVVLPDSTVVWLNSGTTLTYNSSYSVNNRDLSLSGQAYLEVKKNKKLPLIVSSGDLLVKVLGTHFDVSAYPDDPSVKVFLEAGSVELLDSKKKAFRYKLVPGEMAEYYKGSGDVRITGNRTEGYTFWRNGELVFGDTPIAEVIKKLERKFDVKFVISNPTVNKSLLTAKFRNETLKQILDYIQFSCQFSYKMEESPSSGKMKVILY